MAGTISREYNKFSPEFREQAVRLVLDNSRSISQVARELGVNEGTLGNWVNQYRAAHAEDEAPLTPAERAQFAQAQREVRERRMENEFLNYAEVGVMPMSGGGRGVAAGGGRVGVAEVGIIRGLRGS